MAVGVASEKPFAENALAQEKVIACDCQQPWRTTAQTEEPRRPTSPLTRIAMSFPQCWCRTRWFLPKSDLHVGREDAMKGDVGKQEVTSLEDFAERAEELLVSPCIRIVETMVLPVSALLVVVGYSSHAAVAVPRSNAHHHYLTR
jgi:hypothetical protein